MISKSAIDDYIETIPPIPKIVKECVDLLQRGDLILAADVASQDPALSHYLKNIVNKPVFSFREEVKELRQVFGILGIKEAKQLLYSYYLLLILPKKWEVFDFSTKQFQDLQASLIFNWGNIIERLDINDDDIIPAISLIPASLIVCEMLFRKDADTIRLLKEVKNISYEKILKKQSGMSFFEISALIAKKWDFPDKIIDLITSMSGLKKSSLEENNRELVYMKLLLVYEMSRPSIVKSGLNDLFELESNCDIDVVENFYKIINNETNS